MKKQIMPLNFTFTDPNTPKEVERQLQEILIDKLLRQCRESRVTDGYQEKAADS